MAFRQRREDEEECSSSSSSGESVRAGNEKFEKSVVFKPRRSSRKQEEVNEIVFVPERPRSRSRERGTSPEQLLIRPLRKGEQGKSPEEIAKFQQAGFVMSGSRSSRMNAMRALKEESVVDPGAKVVERANREEDIVAHFRDLWKSRNSSI